MVKSVPSNIIALLIHCKEKPYFGNPEEKKEDEINL